MPFLIFGKGEKFSVEEGTSVGGISGSVRQYRS
jgi:hypothetical protein